MDIHKNARLTPLGREHMVNMVLGGQTPKAAGEAVGVCPRTVRKWVERFKRHCASGHMPKPIQHQIIVPKSCRSGFIATIGTDLMVVSKHNAHQPPQPN